MQVVDLAAYGKYLWLFQAGLGALPLNDAVSMDGLFWNGGNEVFAEGAKNQVQRNVNRQPAESRVS